MNDIAIAILAGGESRRMGRDKAKLEFRGEKLLERIARLASSVAPTVVVGRTDDDQFDLPEIEFVPDREPGLGPIGGLRTALEHFGCPVLLLGCDMPLVDTDSLRWLVDRFDDESHSHGLVVDTEEGLQPLFGLYKPDVLPEVSSMLRAGERSLYRLVERSDFDIEPAPESIAERLVNINTPAEFRNLSS